MTDSEDKKYKEAEAALSPVEQEKGKRSSQILSRKVHYEGQVIFNEGDPAHNAYYIESGKVDIIVGKGKHEVVVSTLEAGDIFGEMAIIQPAPRSATVKVRETATLAVISKSELDRKLAGIEDNKAIQALMRILITRLRQANRDQFVHYKNLTEFRDRIMGVVDSAAEGIQSSQRDKFREEVTPHLEKIEELLKKYR